MTPRQSWRESLVRQGGLRPDEVAELEDHLESAMQCSLEKGHSTQRAFEEAIQSLGDSTSIGREFAKGRPAMSPTAKVTGTVMSFALLFFTIAGWSGGGAFINIPSLVFVLGIIIGGLWACFGPSLTFQALRYSLAGKGHSDPETASFYLAVFRRGYHLAWAGGGFGAIIGIIQMLSHLDDPSLIGPGMAMCLLTPFYGAVIAELVFRNLQQWTLNRLPIPVPAPVGRS